MKIQKALLWTASADDDPFSTFKSSIDQLRQRDEYLIPNDFTYKDILTVDDDIAVMGGVMTDEEIVQDLIEVAEEEVEEEDEEVTDEKVTNLTAEEIRKAIDTRCLLRVAKWEQ